MKDSYRKYRFSAISIKIKVAMRFRNFSKSVSDSHTRTLEAMMNFFEWNDLSPHDNLGIQNTRVNKRINAVIAILKNIEKQQTLPTKTMLETLFQEVSNVENAEIKEESFEFSAPETFSEVNELQQYRQRYEDMQQELGTYRNQINHLLEQLTYTKGTFGKGYYKLDIDPQEFETLKKKLTDVYHHHRT